MKFLKTVFLIVQLTVILTSLSCNKTPTESENKSIIALSSRDYVWTVDTIKLPDPYPQFQTIMFALWAVDTNDIYVGGFNSYVYGQLFHYDGKTWDMIILPKYDYGEPWFWDIYGFGKNDIYFVGDNGYEIWTENRWTDSSIVYHYDGSNFTIPLVNKGLSFRTITGTQNDLYVAGSSNEGENIYRFDGTKWEKEDFNVPIPEGFIQCIIPSILKRRDGTVFMNVDFYKPVFATVSYNQFIKRDNAWVKADSQYFDADNIDPNYMSKWGLRFWESPNGILYSVWGGGDIFKYNGATWDRMINGDLIAVSCMDGTDDNNLFAAGNVVVHFNGKDWYEFKELSEKYGTAKDIQCIKNEVLILFTDDKLSYVVKGVLQN